MVPDDFYWNLRQKLILLLSLFPFVKFWTERNELLKSVKSKALYAIYYNSYKWIHMYPTKCLLSHSRFEDATESCRTYYLQRNINDEQESELVSHILSLSID